ncbi:MAG TPA: MarR family transcriptional regulator [Nocardioides sp.]
MSATASAPSTAADLDPEVLRDLEHQFFVLLRRMRRNLAERGQAVAPGLSALGYGVLDQLARDGSARAADIGCVLGVDKGAMSRTVHHLVELGLVERSSDPDDARALVLELSAHGAERLAEVGRQRHALFLQAMSEWTSDELADLASTLGRYNASVEAALSRAD